MVLNLNWRQAIKAGVSVAAQKLPGIGVGFEWMEKIKEAEERFFLREGIDGNFGKIQELSDAIKQIKQQQQEFEQLFQHLSTLNKECNFALLAQSLASQQIMPLLREKPSYFGTKREDSRTAQKKDGHITLIDSENGGDEIIYQIPLASATSMMFVKEPSAPQSLTKTGSLVIPAHSSHNESTMWVFSEEALTQSGIITPDSSTSSCQNLEELMAEAETLPGVVVEFEPIKHLIRITMHENHFNAMNQLESMRNLCKPDSLVVLDFRNTYVKSTLLGSLVNTADKVMDSDGQIVVLGHKGLGVKFDMLGLGSFLKFFKTEKKIEEYLKGFETRLDIELQSKF